MQNQLREIERTAIKCLMAENFGMDEQTFWMFLRDETSTTEALDVDDEAVKRFIDRVFSNEPNVPQNEGMGYFFAPEPTNRGAPRQRNFFTVVAEELNSSSSESTNRDEERKRKNREAQAKLRKKFQNEVLRLMNENEELIKRIKRHESPTGFFEANDF
jgi:hypothetical protein